MKYLSNGNTFSQIGNLFNPKKRNFNNSMHTCVGVSWSFWNKWFFCNILSIGISVDCRKKTLKCILVFNWTKTSVSVGRKQQAQPMKNLRGTYLHIYSLFCKGRSHEKLYTFEKIVLHRISYKNCLVSYSTITTILCILQAL